MTDKQNQKQSEQRHASNRRPQYNGANESAAQRATQRGIHDRPLELRAAVSAKKSVGAAADDSDWVFVPPQGGSAESITTDGGSSSLSSKGDSISSSSSGSHPMPTGHLSASSAWPAPVPKPRQPCPIHGLALHDSHCSLYVHSTPTLHALEGNSLDLPLETWAFVSHGGFEAQAVFGAGAWVDVEYPAKLGNF